MEEKKYKEWTVIGSSEKNGYTKCRCSCGKILDVRNDSLRSPKECFCCADCARKKRVKDVTSNMLERKKQQYEGKTVNGFFVERVYLREFPNRKSYYTETWGHVKCPECGEYYDLNLRRIFKTISCDKCSRKKSRAIATLDKNVIMDGSSLLNAKMRLEGKTNKNSTTGVNGVTYNKRVKKYIARITFRKVDICLGRFDTLEEAAKVRGLANDIILRPYLAQYAGWEDAVQRDLDALAEKNREESAKKNKGKLKKPELRKCSQCGKLYWTKSKYSYMCEDCAKAVKSSSVLRTRVCARCGAEFEGYPRSKYCPKCKPEVEREQAAERRKHKPRKIGSEDICEACGKPYIVKSGLQKYCPECAKTVVPETVREHKREYMAGHSEEFNAARGEKRKKSKEK